MTRDDVRTASTVLARAKMDRYNDSFDFIKDKDNANSLESWMLRLLGHSQEAEDVVASLEKFNLIQPVARLMQAAIESGSGSLCRSLSLDISDEHWTDDEAVVE